MTLGPPTWKCIRPILTSLLVLMGQGEVNQNGGQSEGKSGTCAGTMATANMAFSINQSIVVERKLAQL